MPLKFLQSAGSGSDLAARGQEPLGASGSVHYAPSLDPAWHQQALPARPLQQLVSANGSGQEAVPGLFPSSGMVAKARPGRSLADALQRQASLDWGADQMSGKPVPSPSSSVSRPAATTSAAAGAATGATDGAPGTARPATDGAPGTARPATDGAPGTARPATDGAPGAARPATAAASRLAPPGSSWQSACSTQAPLDDGRGAKLEAREPPARVLPPPQQQQLASGAPASLGPQHPRAGTIPPRSASRAGGRADAGQSESQPQPVICLQGSATAQATHVPSGAVGHSRREVFHR